MQDIIEAAAAAGATIVRAPSVTIIVIRDAAPPADELLDRARVEAEYPFKFRVVTDAARRGELTLEYAGRKPVARRSELERWMATRRRASLSTVDSEQVPEIATSPREAARAAVAARAS